MQQKNLAGCLVAIGFAVSGWMAQAAELYVAPNGSPKGEGTLTKPYDLATALSGTVGRAGDTFWMTGGTYQLGHATTQIRGAREKPITFRGMSGDHVRVVGSLSLWGTAEYVVFRDFELTSGVNKRVSAQRGAGFKPTDLTNSFEGIQVYVPNCSFVNLVVHDSVRSGFYTSTEATNTLIYGCLVYNVGWASPDNAEGHSYYLQGPGEISENMAINSTGAGFHVYANGEGWCLRDITLEGNLAFGAGAIQNVRPYRDWIVGVDAPAVTADNICLRSNMGYVVPGSSTLKPVQLGREGSNGRLKLAGNYWPQGVVFGKWRSITEKDNLLAPAKSKYAAEIEEVVARLQTRVDQGTEPSKANQFSGTMIFMRPNRYERGRANIVIYNWDRADKVAVNLRSVLSVGDSFEVRNAADFFGPAVVKGIFDGKELELPMKGLTVAKPMGGLKTPTATGPTFNAFVLLPRRDR